MAETAPTMKPAALELPPPPPPELEREPLVARQRGLGWLSDTVAGICERPAPRWWWWAFAASVAAMTVCFAMIAYLVSTGVGVWGLGGPVMWGWAIVNFVWWIGIAHAGTLISAILFLLRQRWRTAVNRTAEAMTIFAVLCAGLFPVIHMGRVWFVWWLAPVPNSTGVWPQFHSPLMWDVFAVGTYFTVSLLFWYLGLVPDLAVMRDRARTRLRKFCYGLLALGWTGGHRQWRHYEKAYLILAGLATPLVLSVHSIVSLDFAVAQLPGWHSTIFPPYFVVGAVFSGFGMVLTLLIPLRKMCGLEDVITVRHIELMGKVTLAMSCLIGYAYLMEAWGAWSSGNPYERAAFANRMFGPYAWCYWTMVTCNVLLPQLFWFREIRRRLAVVWTLSLLINVGMWLERFVIVVTSLSRDFLPASWSYYAPTWVDILTYLGTFGLFFTFFLLFLRFLPMVAIAEVKGVTPQADPHHPLGGARRKGGAA
jgi:molybdopterin-containing oxidoreductase family membrane subunit